MVARGDSLKSLSNVAQIIQKSNPSENPLAHIVAIVRQQLKVDVCSLYILENKRLILVASDGLAPCSIGKVRMGVNEGLTGLAVESLAPVIVNNASEHPRFKYFPETGEERFHSFAAVPLMDREHLVGVLTIQTVEARDFSESEVDLLNLFAFQLGSVIKNLVSLEEILQEDRVAQKPTAQLKGLAIAPGFGIGPAVFLLHGANSLLIPPDPKAPSSPKIEWIAVQTAIDKAVDELKRIEKKFQKKFSKAESDIFYSHRMILADKTFLKKLKTVTDRGGSAIESVQEIFGSYIHEFEKMEDSHFRERAADLHDLQQRILEKLTGGSLRKKNKARGILIADTLGPSDVAHLDPENVQAVLTERGGPTSHAAIIARSLGIPAVMGIPNLSQKIQSGDIVIVDGNLGFVYVNPEPVILREYERVQEKYANRIICLQKSPDAPAVTRGDRRIFVEANVGLFSGLQKIRQYGADGVGLYRTEFPFMVRKKLLTEEEQFELYKKVIAEMQGLPVTFRLLDAGGDKPVEALGLTGSHEANPFLGYRSIRLSLSQPHILKVQLRALLRASVLGPIRILIPMISGIEEIRAVKQIFEDMKGELDRKKIPYDPAIPIGILIEVPSAVWLSHFLIRECDFFSIGTNDLIQYTLAVDRNNERVAPFFEPLHPAVLSAIGHVARIGSEHGKRVTICGEIAGDPFLTPLLVALGVSGLSMIPASIPAVKTVIRDMEDGRLAVLAKQCLAASTIDEVKSFLDPFHREVGSLL